jgi:hypothetical protein
MAALVAIQVVRVLRLYEQNEEDARLAPNVLAAVIGLIVVVGAVVMGVP